MARKLQQLAGVDAKPGTASSRSTNARSSTRYGLLVALNQERAAEERNGLIRGLRPEFQAPQAKKPVQTEMDVCITPALAATSRIAWPKATPDQVRVLRQALAARTTPASPRDLARAFRRAPTDKVD